MLNQRLRDSDWSMQMKPNWKPLEDRLGRARCAGFMYMGRVNGIHLYKHGISRTYINLDDAGNCYIAEPHGCYSPAVFELELAKLEQCLGTLQATLKTRYDDVFIAIKRETLRQQGISLLTIQVAPADVLIQ